MKTYDLGFGNSVCVREAFLNSGLGNPIQFNTEDLLKFDYPAHEGDRAIISITADVIKRQLGLSYRHIFITNGATGGCVISMRAYAQMGYSYCVTREAPYYLRYPKMIQASGLEHRTDAFAHSFGKSVVLLDLPSNPMGLMTDLNKIDHVNSKSPPVILDAVYLNNIYMAPFLVAAPKHDVLVGSYSKLLGINGIRLGWIATNDDVLASKISELVTSEYCGLSTASTVILKHSVFGLDWDRFETSARMKLDFNREEFAKLEKFFDGEPVKDIGMFYYAPMNAKAQKIFNKAGVIWTKGSATGTSDDYARFNLGQNNEYLEDAVTAVLKADRIR